jgi:hypothetical protein
VPKTLSFPAERSASLVISSQYPSLLYSPLNLPPPTASLNQQLHTRLDFHPSVAVESLVPPLPSPNRTARSLAGIRAACGGTRTEDSQPYLSALTVQSSRPDTYRKSKIVISTKNQPTITTTCCLVVFLSGLGFIQRWWRSLTLVGPQDNCCFLNHDGQATYRRQTIPSNVCPSSSFFGCLAVREDLSCTAHAASTRTTYFAT